MISFKANKIFDTQIQQKNGKNKFAAYNVSFVEINPTNKEDVSAIGEVAKDWHKYCKIGEKTFAQDIYRDILFDTFNNNSHKFYAVTNQINNFEKLNSENILGIVQLQNKNQYLHKIEFIQTAPCENYYNKQRNYKNIGAAMIRSIIKLFPQKDIILEPINEAMGFYKKLNFVQEPFSRLLRFHV